jgi:ATP adenylyltransferase
MAMERLWAPWRLSYIKDAAQKPAGDDFITEVDCDSRDRENLVVCRTDLSIVILNRYPYNNGHLLVAPRRAVAELGDMTPDEQLDCQREIVRMVAALRSFLRPEGINIGLNLGKVAGAGLPSHLHWHIVPRWNGDCNFMTVLTDTRVISQSLDELWVQLRQALKLDVE